MREHLGEADYLVWTRAALANQEWPIDNAYIAGPGLSSIKLYDLLGWLEVKFEDFMQMPDEQIRAIYVEAARRQTV